MTEVAKKKELIRVEKHPKVPGSVYADNISDGFGMAILGNKTRTNEKGHRIRERVSMYSTCRESATLVLRALADRKNSELSYQLTNQGIEDFDFERLRLIVTTNISKKAELEAYRRRLFAGKRALNLLEDYAGLEPKSVITTVVPGNTTDNMGNYWMLTGPKEWVTAPQLFSLYTLILRMTMFCNEFGTLDEINTDNVENMLKSLLALSEAVKDRSASSTRAVRLKTDAGHFVHIHRHILPILKNHKKLFFDDVKDNYPASDKFNGYGGITSFVKCATNYKPLTDKFKAIVLGK